jgi:hypothetical protein
MYALGRDYDMRAVHEHACRQLIHTLDASNVLNAIATAEIYRYVPVAHFNTLLPLQ